MKLLALDPSSTATGYALFQDDKLLACGKFKGRTKDPALVRCEAMLAAAQEICLTHAPLEVIVEMPGGTVHRRVRGHSPTGLDIYGMAAGMIYQGCNGLPPGTVTAIHSVTPNGWTAGKSKHERAKWYGAMFKGVYDPEHDKGLDIADAIGLGLWFFREAARKAIIQKAVTA